MKLLESIKYAIKAFTNRQQTPQSFIDGEKFENYVREVFFPQDEYKLIHKTHDFNQNKKDYVEDSTLPDYKFECPETKRQFYVECKLRNITNSLNTIESIENEVIKNETKKGLAENNPEIDQLIEEAVKGKDYIEICTEEQLVRYKTINKDTPVFIVIGFAIDQKDYKGIYLVHVVFFSIDELITNSLQLDWFDDYIIANNFYITPNNLWMFFKDNLPRDGYCVRCGSEIDFNMNNMFCLKCWKEWYKYNNYTYKEKYCHMCKKEHKSSAARPVCMDCYNKLKI